MTQPAPQLRIRKITLKNIRCFEDVVIDLAPDGKPAQLGVILGDNGVGKSTLMKAIALGLSSTRIGSGLFALINTPLVRKGELKGRIVLEFDDGDTSDFQLYKQDLPSPETIADHSNFSVLLQLERFLVCGFGAGRFAFGDKSFSSYSFKDAVSSLFNYEARLQNPELILRRLMDSTKTEIDGHEVLKWIDEVLLLPQGSTRLGDTGLEISGPWGDFTPVGSLGDGYKATLAWIMDFIGWVMYFNPLMLRDGIQGIVLVDEIEQHLHPSWQRRIFQVLTRQFPGVQFITTTHSPLCVIGTTDLQDSEVSITHLRRNGTAVEAVSGKRPPRGVRADQVLTSYLFGLETTSDNQTQSQIERLSKLLGKRHQQPLTFTQEEEQEIQSLQEKLEQQMGSGETELERHVTDLLTNNIQQHALTVVRTADSLPPEAIDLEVKRQIQQLFGKV
ncbi:MAG: AAA family ATPase [Blastocatellia bacterium]|nr:AAA family ATPase [Blastocatellia bacterium]